MGYFKDVLGSGESLFRDHIPLDFDYIPKLVPYRENEQKKIASCIQPLFQNRNGRNLFMYGPPGVGKTVACRHLLKELEDETDDIIPIYMNCWQKNTTYKVLLEVCDLLGYKFTHNKKSDELFKVVRDILNKKSVVFVFDEADKLEDKDVLYYILEEIYRKSIILITNYKEWIIDLDERIKSRLTAELLPFNSYNREETIGILRERAKYAFVEGVFDEDAFMVAANRSYELNDVRSGLYLLKEAGNAAEDESSKKITVEHVKKAIQKLEEFTIKKKEELDDDTRFVMGVIKKNPGRKIGELFEIYQKEGGQGAYKTFQRRIAKLAENKFINVKKVTGAEGNTTIVTSSGSVKTLDEF